MTAAFNKNFLFFTGHLREYFWNFLFFGVTKIKYFSFASCFLVHFLILFILSHNELIKNNNIKNDTLAALSGQKEENYG